MATVPISTVVAALVACLVPSAMSADSMSKLDPSVLPLSSSASVDVSVQFSGDHRAHPPSGLSDSSKRTHVFSALSALAESAQRNAMRLANEHGLNCTGFWIVNRMHCKGANQQFLLAATRLPEVSRIQLLGGMYRVKPINGSGLTSLPRDAGWNTNLVNLPEAWKTSTGQGVTVAIIDGGVRYTHEALVESYRGTVDGSASKYDHDYNWFDPVYKNKSPEGSDTDGHGTHVTATAAGGKGIGAAPGAKWIHAKACNFAGYCSDDWSIATAQWVMCPTPVGRTQADCSKGASVVSCSWGEDHSGDDYMKKVTSAWEAAGMIGVFAVGNSGPDCNSVASPSDYPIVLGVGATDKDDTLADFSSRGPSSEYSKTVPSLVAPGVYVPSAWYKGDDVYYHLSGTSQACPLVAGTAALVKAANPKLSPAQVRDIIVSTAEQSTLSAPAKEIKCGNATWDSYPNDIYGNGRLDAASAVKKATLMA